MSLPMYQDTFPVEKKIQSLKFDWTRKSVVEIGCNIGQLGNHVLNRGAQSYVGHDLIEAYVEEGKRRYPHLDLRCGKAQDADLSADVFVALGVFHHMDNASVIGCLSRTTATWAIIEQPMSSEKFQNYKMRSRSWYGNAFLAAGFERITEFDYGFYYPIERRILLAEKPQ